MAKLFILSLALMLAVGVSGANSAERYQQGSIRSLRVNLDESYEVPENVDSDKDNSLSFAYDPFPKTPFKKRPVELQPDSLGDLLTDDSNRYSGIERESAPNSQPNAEKPMELEKKAGPKPRQVVEEAPSSASKATDASRIASREKINAIGFNNREFRLMGPEQRPVEVKSDVATQAMIAWDNLQKEASEGWDQVRSRVDKGWTEFKTMVEGVLDPKNSQRKRASSLL